MDGNMKNHRSVCVATAAGYTEYDRLMGKVQTGCPNLMPINPAIVICTNQ